MNFYQKPLIPMTEYETSSEEVKREYEDQIQKHGRITNMKRTLLHDVQSFKTYMDWYTLYDELCPVFGNRALQIFSYAISTGNDCLICGLFFTKILIDNGEDLENLQVNETEQLLIDFGVAITKNPHKIPQEIYDKLRAKYSDKVLVQLIAFAGIMYATNLFNTVAKVPLDEELYGYRSKNESGEDE
ncbi:MAG: hypothetical protein IJM02_01895 [Clostridia bacterium]|nr:hypothetical protein [Clostridia bacterium]